MCDSEKYNVICVSETWLSDTIQDNVVRIHGYNLVRNVRHWGGGEGIS